jgi:hypothetical protein
VGTAPSRPAADVHWRGWAEVRADLPSALRVALAVAVAGVPAGVLWWLLAPRADFRITDTGPEPIGTISDELLVADDAVLALVLIVTGLVAGLATWFLSRRRGVAAVLALAVGASLTAVLAWQVGELLGAGPTRAQLTEVGARVTTALRLGSVAVLAVAPFAALLAYLAATVCARDDGLGRTAVSSPSSGSRTGEAAPERHPAPAAR